MFVLLSIHVIYRNKHEYICAEQVSQNVRICPEMEASCNTYDVVDFDLLIIFGFCSLSWLVQCYNIHMWCQIQISRKY